MIHKKRTFLLSAKIGTEVQTMVKQIPLKAHTDSHTYFYYCFSQ
jgi:hypothetical protein